MRRFQPVIEPYNRFVKRLGQIAVLGCIPAFLMAQGRVRPPESLGCDRNELTSFTGEVTRYSRTDRVISLAIHTDANTNESFELPEPVRLRFGGQEFRAEDWSKVESAKGKLKEEVRATVWVCEGGPKTLDWEPPKE